MHVTIIINNIMIYTLHYTISSYTDMPNMNIYVTALIPIVDFIPGRFK